MDLLDVCDRHGGSPRSDLDVPVASASTLPRTSRARGRRCAVAVWAARPGARATPARLPSVTTPRSRRASQRARAPPARQPRAQAAHVRQRCGGRPPRAAAASAPRSNERPRDARGHEGRVGTPVRGRARRVDAGFGRCDAPEVRTWRLKVDGARVLPKVAADCALCNPR